MTRGDKSGHTAFVDRPTTHVMRAEDWLGAMDTGVLAAVAAGEVDLNELALRELGRRAPQSTQLELDFDDVPVLLRQQAF